VAEKLVEQVAKLLLPLKLHAFGEKEPGILLTKLTCPVGVNAGSGLVIEAVHFVDKPNWISDGEQETVKRVLIGTAAVLVPGSNSTVEVDVKVDVVLDDVVIALAEVVEDEDILVVGCWTIVVVVVGEIVLVDVEVDVVFVASLVERLRSVEEVRVIEVVADEVLIDAISVVKVSAVIVLRDMTVWICVVGWVDWVALCDPGFEST
jgi:hypothetical protein